MKSYFRFMTSAVGRALRFLLGAAIVAWGYANFGYPDKYVLMTIGAVYALFALGNVSLFGMAYVDSWSGRDIIAELNAMDGMPARRNLIHGMWHVLKTRPTHGLGWGVKKNQTLAH